MNLLEISSNIISKIIVCSLLEYVSMMPSAKRNFSYVTNFGTKKPTCCQLLANYYFDQIKSNLEILTNVTFMLVKLLEKQLSILLFYLERCRSSVNLVIPRRVLQKKYSPRSPSTQPRRSPPKV